MRFLRLTALWLTLLLLSAQAVQAATTVAVNFTRETGIGPFDGNDAPGNDSGTSNAIIRTNDTISYKFEVLVQGGDASNIRLRLNVAPGLILSLPAFCRQSGVSPPSAISGDAASGYSVLCNVGDVGEGSQVLYAMPAKVAADRPHGSTVSLITASIESDQTAPENFPGSSDTVSAAPKLDLIKNGHTRVIGRRAGPNGEDGVVYVFPIIVTADEGAKGNELVTAPISFTDNLSGASPNARLFQAAPGQTWAGALPDACVQNYAIPTYRIWSQIPRGSVRTADGGPGGPGAGPIQQSVWNSGEIDCTVPATGGGTTTVTITGADLSGAHQPTKSANNGGLPANSTYLVAGVMVVWIPLQDIQDAGGTLAIANIYGSLNAVSISNQSNVEPDTANNTKSFVAKDGNGGRYFYNHLDHNTFSLLPGQTSRRAGDGYVLPGQKFATRHYQFNRNWLTKTGYNNFTFCTSFNNATQTITEITPGQGAKMHFSGTYEGGQAPYTIEYGTGGFGNTTTCENADSPDGWHSTIDSVPGGAAAITKVRAFTPYFSPPGGNSTQTLTSLIVRYTALDNPTGTLVAQWGAFKYDEANRGNWIFGTPYDETTALGSYGDRLSLTKVSTAVNKDTVPSGDDQALAGEQVTFRIQPSATTPIDPPGLTADVTITDTLPEWFDYVLSSASPPPTSTSVNPDGTTTLVWNFPNTVINSAMSAITYDVIVKPTTPDQTSAVNRVVSSSPSDGSVESARTDEYGILVLNPSGFSVYKSPTPALVAPNGDFGFELTYANTGTSDFAKVVLIDVLPNMTVGQNPPTDFNGIAEFISISGTSGEVFEYSKTLATAIVKNPNDASNQPGGTTVWCSGFTGGACPANASEVTAFRATSPAFPEGAPTRVLNLKMTALNNDAFNVYSNNFTAQADGLAFAVTSPVATSRVRTADLSLQKTVLGADTAAKDSVDFTLTVTNSGPHDAAQTIVRDQLPAGYQYLGDNAGGAYNPATGDWTIPRLPVNGSASLVIRARVLPTGPYLNEAEIIAQQHADPDSSPNNRGTAPTEDDTASASIFAYLSGNVFLDNGLAGGIAYDGLINGGELPSNAITLSITDTTTGVEVVSPTVNTDGTWFAVLAGGGPDQLQFSAFPKPGYTPVSENTSALSGVVNSNGADGAFLFTPMVGGVYTGINVGLIVEPTLTQDQTGSIQPGQITDLAHRYEASSAGVVSFSILNQLANPANAFASTIFADTNCDGQPDQVMPSALSVVAGQSVCLVVRTQAAAGIGPGARYTYDVQAITSFTGTSASHTTSNSDTIGSGGQSAAELTLRKLVRNVTANSPEGTSNTGDIGDTLTYRIIMQNPTPTMLSNVKINDMTPAYTVLAVPVVTPITLLPGVTCYLSVPVSGNVAGYIGPLEWTCPNGFPPNSEASVSFSVMIAP